jgi:putative DNA primase/helicase
VLWALEGLDRLRQRGHLIRPQSADELHADMVEQTSPIRAFVEECCVLGEGNQVDRDDLFGAWRKWCETQGRDHPGTKVGFGRQLAAAFPEIKRAQPRVSGTGSDGSSRAVGTRLNVYSGARLKHNWEGGPLD